MPPFAPASTVLASLFCSLQRFLLFFFGFERWLPRRKHQHSKSAFGATPVERSGPGLRLDFAPSRLFGPLHLLWQKSPRKNNYFFFASEKLDWYGFYRSRDHFLTAKTRVFPAKTINIALQWFHASILFKNNVFCFILMQSLKFITPMQRNACFLFGRHGARGLGKRSKTGLGIKVGPNLA